MSTEERRASREVVPDSLILAAIERANLHEGRALRSHVAEHLGYRHRPPTTRWLRPRMEALEEAGQVAQHRSLGLTYWSLTDVGARRLAEARRAGEVGALPESPQHREWRAARSVARDRIDEITAAALAVVAEAEALLTAAGAPSPEDVDRLRRDLDRRFSHLRTRRWAREDPGLHPRRSSSPYMTDSGDGRARMEGSELGRLACHRGSTERHVVSGRSVLSYG